MARLVPLPSTERKKLIHPKEIVDKDGHRTGVALKRSTRCLKTMKRVLAECGEESGTSLGKRIRRINRVMAYGLTDEDWLDMAFAMMSQAKRGNVAAFVALADRVLGKPIQTQVTIDRTDRPKAVRDQLSAILAKRPDIAEALAIRSAQAKLESLQRDPGTPPSGEASVENLPLQYSSHSDPSIPDHKIIDTATSDADSADVQDDGDEDGSVGEEELEG